MKRRLKDVTGILEKRRERAPDHDLIVMGAEMDLMGFPERGRRLRAMASEVDKLERTLNEIVRDAAEDEWMRSTAIRNAGATVVDLRTFTR